MKVFGLGFACCAALVFVAIHIAGALVAQRPFLCWFGAGCFWFIAAGCFEGARQIAKKHSGQSQAAVKPRECKSPNCECENWQTGCGVKRG